MTKLASCPDNLKLSTFETETGFAFLALLPTEYLCSVTTTALSHLQFRYPLQKMIVIACHLEAFVHFLQVLLLNR